MVPTDETQYPYCPVCERECETIYIDRNGEIVGCDCCVTRRDAWEIDECFPMPD